MPDYKFVSMETPTAAHYQAGGADANGQPPVRRIAEQTGGPCRHCQQEIQVGEACLLLSHMPFSGRQPFAESGPVFLHAEACERYGETADIPAMFANRTHFILRGYTSDNAIAYGAGRVIETAQMDGAIRELLALKEVAYLHIRNAPYNCFQVRVERIAGY